MNILGSTFIFVVSFSVCAGIYQQASNVQAILGKSVILPCDVSRFQLQEQEELYWEAMGKDVLSVDGDIIRVGRAFEERVSFLRDPVESKDFSLVLTDVMLNDEDVYECFLPDKKVICFVFLKVFEPEWFPEHVEAVEGEDVTLDCFGNIPKYKPWEDMYIQWLKDDKEILRLSSGKMDVSINSSVLALPSQHIISRGVLSLTIQSVSGSDQGVYRCRYKSMDYEEPKSGLPERQTLTVWAMSSGMSDPTDSFSSVSLTSHTHTHTSVPAWTTVASTPTEAGRTTPTHTHATTDQTEMSISVPTHTDAVSTQTTAPTHTHTERAEDVSAVPEAGTVSGQRDPQKLISDQEIPWIRIGLIAGVLLVTAVVLGLLLTFGRI